MSARKVADARERIEKLRNIFSPDTVENWILFSRDKDDTPKPGELGYNRETHVLALHEAILNEMDNRLELAGEHQGKATKAQHNRECAAIFAATMEVIAYRNRDIAEAYRYEAAKHSQQVGPGEPGLRLVWSR